MRIIAGEFRGRKLKRPRGTLIRPTADRLRESLFDILTPYLGDAVFLDLFAGTGAVGLEAISRGAREAVFIESADAACRLIRENLQACGVAEGYRILQQDIFQALRRLAREEFCADLVFADPPYEWGPYSDLLEILFRTGLVGDASRVIVEHHRRVFLPETGEEYQRVRLLRQSDKCLSFYRFKGERDSGASVEHTPSNM